MSMVTLGLGIMSKRIITLVEDISIDVDAEDLLTSIMVDDILIDVRVEEPYLQIDIEEIT